jgi:hypothetical protein
MSSPVYSNMTRIAPVIYAKTQKENATCDHRMNFCDKVEFSPYLFTLRYERIVSVNIPIRDEYPIIP